MDDFLAQLDDDDLLSITYSEKNRVFPSHVWRCIFDIKCVTRKHVQHCVQFVIQGLYFALESMIIDSV